MNVRLVLMALAVLVPTAVPAVGTGKEPNGPAVMVIATGDQSGVQHTAIFHVMGPSDFASMWAQHARISLPPMSAPKHETDFERRHVLGVFLGQRPTGGYTVRVASVRAGCGKVRILLEERLPGLNCSGTSSLTQPFAIVEVPRLPWPSTFERVVDRRAGPPCE